MKKTALRTGLTLCLLTCASAARAAPEWVVHVDASAAGAGDGSPVRPFAAPAQALAALKARTAAQRAQPARVVLHAGTYVLAESLKMGADESGSDKAQVQWQADGEVVFSGGIPIPTSALHPVADAATLARLPACGGELALYEIRLADLGLQAFPPLEKRLWPELFQDGLPLPLSAWPNGTGYANGFKPAKIIEAGTTAKVTAGGASSTENQAKGRTMVFAVGDARTKRWKNAMDAFHAEVWFGGHWFWDWSDDFLPAASIGEGGVVTMGKPHPYGLGKFANLRVYNLVEEMDAPGEYAIEPAQKRLLVLLSKSAAAKPLTLSWLGAPLVSMDQAAHVRMEGIRFAYGRGDGVSVKDGADIAFAHCAFVDLAGNGVVFQGRQLSAEDCLFEHIGLTGAQLTGGDSKTLTHADNRAAHCTFADFGRLKRTYAPAVKLEGVGSTVENCLMSDAPHSAVLYGGQEHLIRNNEIRHVLTETGDCGAIYSGRDWTAFGTVISGNWIHDLKGMPGRWPCGIYLDDQLSGITVKNNLIERASLGILVGGGRYDLVEGNILNDCQEAISLDSRGLQAWTGKMQITLHERLDKIPASQEPWKSRHPEVADTLKNQPNKPVGTRVTGNGAVHCAAFWKRHETSGVAVDAPNWEKLPKGALVESGRTVKVTGTPLVFVKPEVGVRP